MQCSFTFTTLWANSADNKLVIFFLFYQKMGVDIGKPKRSFFESKKKNYFKMSSDKIFTESAKWVVFEIFS